MRNNEKHTNDYKFISVTILFIILLHNVSSSKIIILIIIFNRDIFTKRPIKKDLTVPKGIPLSLFCGMCIRPSVSLVPILTNFQGDTPLAQEVVKSGNEIRHKKYGNQCFLTYALTG